MTKNVWHLYRCYTCTCIYTYVYIYVICVCVCVSYIYHKCIIYHRLISYIYIMYMIPTYVLYTYHAIWCLTPDFTGWSPELCWSPDKLPPPRCISNGLCTPALWPGWCWQTDHLCLRVRLLVPPFHVQYVYYIYTHM